MNASLSSGLPAMHYSADPLVPTEDLSNMSVEELQAELIRTRQAFHSAGIRLLLLSQQACISSKKLLACCMHCYACA